MAKKPVMHVLSHTHWDREWYQPFQSYRRRLVHQMDAMMDLLEKRPAFKAFHLDGQTSLLYDYLEIRPQERSRLTKHIRSGRVLIGPWFTMPDEVLLSGEAIVRNLMAGCAACADFGVKPMPVGYVSDVFGHVSQFPQIIAGFGMDTVFLHRGTGADNDSSELLWRGADGTEVLVIKAYPWTGYQDFMEYRNADEETIRLYEKRKLALANTPVMFALDGNDHQPAKWDTPESIARMNRIFKKIRAVHSTMNRYVAELKKALGPRGIKRLKTFTGELHIPAHGGRYGESFFGTGSARLPLKKANDELETLLPRVAEPLNAWAVTLGAENEKPYLDRAWRYLFLNHPHDSICGCSQDQVHRDMMYRFDQARILADDTALFAVQEIADRIDTCDLGPDDMVVTVFNPSTAPAGPTARFYFEIPDAAAAAKHAENLAPVLCDERGEPLAADLIEVETRVQARPLMFKTRGLTPAIRPRMAPVNRYHLEAAVEIPPMGYRTFRIEWRRAGKKGALPTDAGAGKRYRTEEAAGIPVLDYRTLRIEGGLASGEIARKAAVKVDVGRRTLENEFLKLAVRDDGRIDLYDRETRTRFQGLHFFEDCGDMGHGWDHYYPDRDLRVLSTDSKSRGKVKVRLARAGRLSATFEVSMIIAVPEDLEYREPLETEKLPKAVRSKRRVRLAITTEFTLRSGSRMVECRTTVENKARCHRLRVMLPSGRNADTWYADLAFDIVRRNVKLIDTKGWVETEREEKHIKNFAAVADEKAGLAVITRGLNEAAVRDDRRRTIALTLFRAFRERLMHETTQDSQLIGTITAEYAIAPFTPERGAPPADFIALVDGYKTPLYPLTHPSLAGAAEAMKSELGEPSAIDPEEHPALKAILDERPAIKHDLPMTGALVEMPRWLALSTLKVSEDGGAVIMRVWNPLTRKRTATVTANFPFRRASLADSLEKAGKRLSAGGNGKLKLPIGAKEIVTLRFEL